MLVISQDLDELFEISDAIAVMHNGELSKPLPRAEATFEKIGLLMGGAEPGHVEHGRWRRWPDAHRTRQTAAAFDALQRLSPFIALGLTLVAGAIMFARSARTRPTRSTTISSTRLREVWSLHELAIKAAPLILIAVGLSRLLPVEQLEHRRRRPVHHRRHRRLDPARSVPDFQSWIRAAADADHGHGRRRGLRRHPGLSQDTVQHQRDPDQPDAGLCRAALPRLAGARSVAQPGGHEFSGDAAFHDYAILPEIWPASGRAHWGFVFAVVAAVVVWFMLARTLKGFEVKVLGQSPRAGRFAGFSSSRMVFFAFLLSGALAGLAGISEVSGAIGQLRPTISPGYGFAAIIVAFLGRLNPLGIVAAGLVLALTYLGGEAAQISHRRLRQGGARLPGHAALLRARLRHADPLPHPLRRPCGRKKEEAAQNV